MQTVRVGLLGAGICAHRFHAPALLQMNGKFKPVALAGGNPEQNREYAALYGGIDFITGDYHEVIARPDVDAVIASYPYFLNEQIVATAREYRKHILVEKPLAQSICSARALRDLDDGSVVMGVGENWLYFDSVGVVRQLLEDGAIGEPRAAAIYSLYEMPADSEYLAGDAWRKSARGGMVLDRSIHSIAYSRAVLGRAASVMGVNASARAELGSQDTMFALVNYASGVVASINVCASAPGIQLPFSYLIVGTEGTIAVSDFMSRVTVSGRDSRVIVTEKKDGGYLAEMENFYDAIVNGTPFLGNFRDAYNDLFCAISALEEPNILRAID